MRDRLWHSIKSLPEKRCFLLLLLLINLAGFIWGIIWYGSQFAETPVYLWLFVPNSPLAVLYMVIVLLLFLQHKRSVFWEGLAYFGLIKHGLWTVMIITVYHFSGVRGIESILLWAGHLGMALQAVLYWVYYGLPLSFSQAAFISLWYLVNDYLDYGIGIFPRVDTTIIHVETVRNLAVTNTVVLTILYLLAAWRFQHRKGSS